MNRVNYKGKNNSKRADTFIDLSTNFFPKIKEICKEKELKHCSKINHLHKNSGINIGYFTHPNVQNFIIYHDQLIDNLIKNSTQKQVPQGRS